MDWSSGRSIVVNSRQIPKLLRHQLLATLTEQYVAETVRGHNASDIPPLEARSQTEPSLKRFYGSLLFVDISGFTALSLQLDVETLKRHINEYFTQMLDIVDKWGGDVVKFAGDALYIVWRAEFNFRKAGSIMGSLSNVVANNTATALIHNPDFLAAASQAIDKAVACGLEITAECSNHKVLIPEQKPTATRWSSLLSSIPLMPHNQRVVPEVSNVALLNVHSGIGFGLMGGIDIGSHDRWEYFLLGNPTAQVAAAEGHAGKGDVVLSSAAHELLHPTPHINSSGESTKVPHGCGCVHLEHGFCKITVSGAQRFVKPAVMRRRSKAKLSLDDQPPGASAVAAQDSVPDKAVDDVVEDIQIVFSAAQAAFKHRLLRFLHFKHIDIAKHGGLDLEPLFVESITEMPDRAVDRFCTDFVNDKVRPMFVQWLQRCALDDVLMHNHEAARTRLDHSPEVRSGALYDLLQAEFPPEVSSPAPFLRQSTDSFRNLFKLGARSDFTRSRTDLGTPTKNRRQNSRLRGGSFLSPGNAGVTSLLEESNMTAELRTVTVMFIKIEAFASELFVDTEPARPVRRTSTDVAVTNQWVVPFLDANSVMDKFNFLRRTAAEEEKDGELLSRLQECMKVLCAALAEHGGQVRQFIVDDKGTVCIGTFGLRGSAAVDNAASAVEAAKHIVINLHKQGLIASIGITSGKAYCGYVGSPTRHEYAVMGPSTNLSARLMCQAPPYTIICDQETKAKDRSHTFETLGEVKAKGYEKMVKIFKPVFEDLVGAADLNEAYAALSPGSHGKRRMQGILRSSLDSLNLGSLLASSKVQELSSRGPEVSINLSSTAQLVRRDKPRARDLNTTIGILASSEFLFPRRQGLGSSSDKDIGTDLDVSTHQTVHLHGREDDLATILKFLLLGIVKNAVHRKAPRKEAMAHLWETLDNQCRSRMVVVSGKDGMGKSALLSAVARKLFGMQKKYPKINLFVIKSKVMTLAQQGSVQPFLAWKTAIQSMLWAAHNRKPTDTIASSSGTTASARGRSYQQAVELGLQVLLPAVPEDLHPLLPLLGWAGILPPSADTETTAQLSGSTRAAKCMDLLVFLVQAFSNIAESVAFFVLEKVQLFDSWSLTLLQRVWANTCGSVFLVSHSPAQPTVDETGLLVGEEFGSEPFAKFNDPERFLNYSLAPLGRDALLRMARDVAQDCRQTLSDEVLGRVHEISGGNALYAFEMVHTLCASAIHHDETFLHNLESALVARSSRIEEVICYRFDNLAPIAQLVLKHAAVAASNRSSFDFAVLKHLLVDNKSRVVGEDQESLLLESSIAEALERLLLDEDFLMFEEDGLESRPRDSIPEEDAAALADEYSQHPPAPAPVAALSSDPGPTAGPTGLRAQVLTRPVCFRALVEQITIYNLLVEEQKEAIHDLAATYLHRRNQRKLLTNPSMEARTGILGLSISTKLPRSAPSPEFYATSPSASFESSSTASLSPSASLDAPLQVLTVHDVLEEAHHWERACVFNFALLAYYQAATLSKHLGDLVEHRNHLQCALRIFMLMKQDVGINIARELTAGRVQQLMDGTHDAPVQARSSSRTDQQKVWLTAELLEEMCYSNRDVVEVVVRVHTELAQSMLRRFDAPSVVLHLTSEGLQVMQLAQASTWGVAGARATPKAPTPQTATTPGGRRLASMRQAVDRDTTNDRALQQSEPALQHYAELQPPLLSAFCVIHVLALNPEVPDKVEQAHLLARHMHSRASPGSVHQVQALLLLVLVHVRLGAQHSAQLRRLIDELLELYDPASMSAPLVQVYGADLVLYSAAVGAQALLTCGEGREVERALVPRLVQDLYSPADPHSAVVSCLPVIALLNALRRYHEALQVFSHMQDMEAQMGEGSEAVFLCDAFTSRLHAVLSAKDQNFPSAESGSARSLRSNVSAKLRVSGTLRADQVLSAELFNPSAEDQLVAAASRTNRPVAEAILFFCGLSETALMAESVLLRTIRQAAAKKDKDKSIAEEAFPWAKLVPYLEQLCKRSSHYAMAAINIYQPLVLLVGIINTSDECVPAALGDRWLRAARQYAEQGDVAVTALLLEALRGSSDKALALAVADVQELVAKAVGPERAKALAGAALPEKRRHSFALPT